MKIIWQAEDGYAGGARPHSLTIPDGALEGLTEDEREDYIEQAVQEDFNNTVYPSWRIAS